MLKNTIQGLVAAILIMGMVVPSGGSARELAGEMEALPTSSGLYRSRVAVRQPAGWARLEKLGVTVLERGEDWALVLADEEQLEALARLRSQPQGTDELGMLVGAHAQAKPWLATSLRPLLSQAAAAKSRLEAEAVAAAEAYADVRASLRALTPEQMAGITALSSVDDDADGLTNTQEAWWCTDPMDLDTDDDGRTDGAEIQVLKDWLGNRRAGPPTETPWPDWPPQRTGCDDKDHDSIPNLAERWELGLNMDLESSDRDKFDDGQELFGVTYCPGGDLSCDYGDLPRSADSGYVGAAMPSWVKAPGKHPLVAAFPVPEVDVVESSLRVQAVTQITDGQTITSGTEHSYSTAKTEGTSTSVAQTKTWNDWEEVSDARTQPVAAASPLDNIGLSNTLINYQSTSVVVEQPKPSALGLAGSLVSLVEAPGKVWNAGVQIGNSINEAIYLTAAYGAPWNWNGHLDEYDEMQAREQLAKCRSGQTCRDPATGVLLLDGGPYAVNQQSSGQQAQNFTAGNSGVHTRLSDSDATSYLYHPIQVSINMPPTQTHTETKGRSWGGAETTTNEQYEEHTITNGEAFLNQESWNHATAVDSAHAADFWFTYKVRNTGTEYAREIADLAFNVYIGDDPNPVYTYFVGPDLGGDGKFHNFMPAEEHTYTARHIPLTLDQMRDVDLGGPLRVVVEDFTYGADELFYQDAANAGVLLAMEDGTDDGDEAIDNYLIPTWGSETVLDILARYFPNSTDAEGNLVAIWTPEYRSDAPAWCVEPNVVGSGSQTTVWCKHALSTADWWNVYTDGMGDGSEGFQDTLASPGQVALFRFNKDSDLDGYSDRSEARLGTEPDDPASFPKPEMIAGVHSIGSGSSVVATLSLLNTGLYDAYGVEAVMIAPDDSISITNNTVGGSGRVRAQRQVIVGSRILLQSPLPDPWTQEGHAVPAAGGYYIGQEDRTYAFTVQCGEPTGCHVGSTTWTLDWGDGVGESGSLNFGNGYASPTFLDVGAFGVQLALYTGEATNNESFTVEARTPRDTFQYTINEEPYTEPVVIVSYNDPQGNHRFVTPLNLSHPTEDLVPHSGKMIHDGAGVDIVTDGPFTVDMVGQPVETTVIAQVPVPATLVDAHLFLEFIDPEGTVVREEATTVTLEPGPNVVVMTWDSDDFNPAYDPEQDYIVMAFFTDWQGNILDTAARPLSSFQEDPKAVFALDPAGTTWDFGTIPQGELLEHRFTLANTGMMSLKATVVGTGVRADQDVPGNPAWTDTGLDVAAGDAIGIRASGTVCYATSTLCFGPDGNSEPATAGYLLPGSSKFSLIARIGSDAPFFVGSSYVGSASSAGRLFLGTNDSGHSDNTGSYQVHVEIQGVPGSFHDHPSFSVSPTGATNLDVTLDTYYLPVGPFNRTVLVRTSDPAHPTQVFQVQGTVDPYVAPARAMAVSPYRPWDQRVAVSGDRNEREVITFDDTIAVEPNDVQPIRVYDDTGEAQLGAGKEVAHAEASAGRPTLAFQGAVSPGGEAATDGTVAGVDHSDVSVQGSDTSPSRFGDGSDGDLLVPAGEVAFTDEVRMSVGNSALVGEQVLILEHVGDVNDGARLGDAAERLAAGDEVLVVQMQGGDAGHYESAVVADVRRGILELQRGLRHEYVVDGHARVQILRVPHYRNVTIEGTLTAHPWDGKTGGVLAFRASGTTHVGPTGDIDVTGQGYVGGPGGNEYPASRTDTGSTGASYTNSSPLDGPDGDDCGGCISPEGPWNGGGGRGGRGSRGEDGASGGGGASYGTSGVAGDTGPRSPHPPGGAPGSTYGSADLTTLYLGSGGGGGGKGKDGWGASGGDGGGIVDIHTDNLVVSGWIRANGDSGGSDTGDGHAGGGGGGSGGSIFLDVNTATLGNSLVTAVGGSGSDGVSHHGGARGGNGGSGRIRIEHCDAVSGSTNPLASMFHKSCYGTVAGKAFSDNNGNANQDAGEPNLASVDVSLSDGQTTTTDGNGNYSFTANAPGNYTVSATPPDGYDCISPPGCSKTFPLEPDQTVIVNFAMRPRASIVGKVFHDTNNNGSPDAGEPGIAGLTVTLDGTGQTDITSSDGSYSFESLLPGTYSVSITPPDGYLPTVPDPPSRSCNLTPGSVCTANFGILQYTIEKSGDHDNRLFLPEDFRGGRRYWVQYGHKMVFNSVDEQEAQVRLPKAHYSAATLEVLLVEAGNSYVEIDIDVGDDGTWDWGYNGNLTMPTTLEAGDFAEDLNDFMQTATPDGEGFVTVPLRLSLNTSGRLYLTNFVGTPDGISDVAVMPTDAALSPTDPVEGDTVDIQITMHNDTPFDTSGFVVSAYATAPDWGEVYVGSAYVPNVAASDTYTANIAWDTLGFTGDVPVRVVLDPSDSLDETDEDNNEATANLIIRTRPDLQVTQMILSDDEPVVGQTVTVALALHNGGQTAAGTSTLALYDGNPESGGVLLGEDMPDVPGESEAVRGFAWTPVAPGAHRLFAISDRDNGVSEFDEGNNQTWQDVYVGFAGPILLDSGGASDVTYTLGLGYGYVDEGQADEIVNCGSEPYQTLRRDPGGRVVYRFDHLLPGSAGLPHGHFYHLDLILYECDDARREESVFVDGNPVAGPQDLGDEQPHCLSLRLDPALYADHAISVTVEAPGVDGAVVSEINLHDVDYRYMDSGGASDVGYADGYGYGYLDGAAITAWGTLPYQSVRVDQSNNELRYQFDDLSPARKYQVNLTFWQPSGTGRQQKIEIDGIDTGETVDTGDYVLHTLTVDVPQSAYDADGSIVVGIVRTNAGTGAMVNEIALEEKTQECQFTPPPTCEGIVETPTQVSFWSINSTLDGQPLPLNTLVEAYDPDGVRCGCDVVDQVAGSYGLLPVYGDDAGTSGTDEGAEAGDTISFYINRSACPAATLGPDGPIWTSNGAIQQVDLQAITPDSLNVPLDAGWNLFSSRIEPCINDVRTVLTPLTGHYSATLGYTCEDQALSHYPWLPDTINTLQTLDADHGYWLKTDVAATLPMTGTMVEESQPITLCAGWNLVSYRCAASLPITQALQTINGQYDYVSSFDGGALIYSPSLPPWINTLHEAQPDHGYWIHMLTPGTLTYPCGIVAAAGSSPPAISPPSDGVTPTPQWVSFWGQQTTMLGRPVPVGAVVQAFDPDDVLCGETVVTHQGSYGLLPVYADDTMTPEDEGAQPGDVITFRINGMTAHPAEAGAQAIWTTPDAIIELDLTVPGLPVFLPLVGTGQ